MRKVLVLLAGLLMAITVASPPAGAITGDYVEDFEHPFVGLVAFYDEDGELPPALLRVAAVAAPSS